MSKQIGFDCEDHADGSRTCRAFKAKRNGLYATGTNVEIITDPNTCSARVVGPVMEEDRDRVMREVKELESRCKKGFH